MKKALSINTGTALLLSDHSDAFSGYDSISINTGTALISKAIHKKLESLGATINSGSTNVIEISGEIVELGVGTIITADSSYPSCYLVCTGKLIVEDAAGLDRITGLYAGAIYHPESVDLGAIKNITAERRIAYRDDAKLHLGNMALDGDSVITLEASPYHVSGTITALDGDVLEKLMSKKMSFACKKLIIYVGLYEKYKDMFASDGFTFIPDGHAVVDDITLDAATAALYGDKLYAHGDFTVHHDQVQYLDGFSSIVVKGKAIMPTSVAAAFRACGGKADNFSLYKGTLMKIDGSATISRQQLQTATQKGISYWIVLNGSLDFDTDVTADDIDAIAGIHCNGSIEAPGSARAALIAKIKEMNGSIDDIESSKDKAQSDEIVNSINTGIYRL